MAWNIIKHHCKETMDKDMAGALRGGATVPKAKTLKTTKALKVIHPAKPTLQDPPCSTRHTETEPTKRPRRHNDTPREGYAAPHTGPQQSTTPNTASKRDDRKIRRDDARKETKRPQPHKTRARQNRGRQRQPRRQDATHKHFPTS